MKSLIQSVTISLSLFLMGCSDSDDHHDLSLYVNQLKQMPSKQANLLDTIHFRAKNSLSGQVIHSPFPENTDTANALLLNKPPLQRYPLDALHLLGIVQQAHLSYAVIQAPDSKTYQVARGDYIGSQNGTVTQINTYDMSIIEPADPTAGILAPRSYTMRLKAA